MASQTQKGKAYEYACLKALYDNLNKNQEVEILETSAFSVAKSFYDSLDESAKIKMIKAANAAVKILLKLEPQLENHDENIPLFLQIQEDSKGMAGDVRDVVCLRNQNGWEIGLSCKHNHSAVKHSRLSNTIDFGALWFDKSCSKEYFLDIEPIFSELVKYKDRVMRWDQIANKSDFFYVPLLDAFVKELKRLDKYYPNEIPAKLISYLLGKNDFYKVISRDSKKLTIIQAYNLYNTLNKNTKNIKPLINIQQLKLPTKFYDISYKENSKNTIVVTCDGGWALSFRIHNASSKVEPSLKFDVQLVGVPQGLHTQIEPWEE